MTWHRALHPTVAAEIRDLNTRLDSLRRVAAALMSRRNVLVRMGRPPKKPKQPRLF